MPSFWATLREGASEPLTWAAVTIAAFVVANGVILPRSCSGVVECAAVRAAAENPISRYGMCALATSFVLELISLWVTWKRAKVLVGMVRGVEITFVPPLLLCVTFFVLILENMFICKLWFIHAAAPGVGNMESRPVYSPVILEWLVNVPILLVLCGACALARPIGEVSRPVVVTNLYIVLSWAAYFIVDARARWFAIFVAFGMYAWASVDMVGWVTNFRKTAPQDMPARNLRCGLTYGLIIVFFFYGVVYLAAIAGAISSLTEMFAYIVMNVSVKLCFLVSFVGIRSSQFYDLIVGLLANKVLPFDRQIAIKNDTGHFEHDSTLPLLQ